MTRAESIRKAIKAAGKPLQPREIADARGDATDKERELTYWNIAVQFRDGILGRNRCSRWFEYFVQREPAPKTSPLSAEERRLRKNARERKRMRRNRAQLQAERRAKAAAKAAERERERLQRQAAAAAERERFRAARAAAKAKPKPVKPRHTMPVCVPSKPSVTAPPKPVVRFESVDAYLARGGRIQRIPPGRMAESVLRFEHGARA